jgi:hypothetical protein
MRFLIVILSHLLSLERLSDPEGNAGLVQGLVGVECHPQLVSDPEKEETSLDAIDGALPDDFVEALPVQFASHLTDSSFTGLPLL